MKELYHSDAKESFIATSADIRSNSNSSISRDYEEFTVKDSTRKKTVIQDYIYGSQKFLLDSNQETEATSMNASSYRDPRRR